VTAKIKKLLLPLLSLLPLGAVALENDLKHEEGMMTKGNVKARELFLRLVQSMEEESLGTCQEIVEEMVKHAKPYYACDVTNMAQTLKGMRWEESR
jgi:hypothetical protein